MTGVGEQASIPLAATPAISNIGNMNLAKLFLMEALDRCRSLSVSNDTLTKSHGTQSTRDCVTATLMENILPVSSFFE